jgi:stress-induced morphogen
MVKSRISGKTATDVALEALKRRPIRLLAPDEAQEPPGTLVPSGGADKERKAPPRVRKPSPLHDQCLAPTPDLDNHRKRLREAFGNTMSDEFVEVILGKVVEALGPGALAKVEEPTLNAALALIDSIQPQSELQALLAVQIVATGFSGLEFVQQSQQHMTAACIDVYGSYAIKLFRLQAELVRVFVRCRRGNKHTVDVRHVHIHSGAQGLVGIVNRGVPETEVQAGGRSIVGLEGPVVHRPIRLLAPNGAQEPSGALLPSGGPDNERKMPPRVRKPSPLHDQCLAPTPDLESHRKRLREALGNTMSDEFVEVILDKLIKALKPGPFDQLEEPTLNAALALIDSMQLQSELEALLAVQIVATGFSGFRLLRQSQQLSTAEFIDVYGSYAIKLLRLEAEMIGVLESYQRGNKQTVEVRHVHIHSGAQGMVGVVSAEMPEGDARK